MVPGIVIVALKVISSIVSIATAIKSFGDAQAAKDDAKKARQKEQEIADRKAQLEQEQIDIAAHERELEAQRNKAALSREARRRRAVTGNVAGTQGVVSSTAFAGSIQANNTAEQRERGIIDTGQAFAAQGDATSKAQSDLNKESSQLQSEVNYNNTVLRADEAAKSAIGDTFKGAINLGNSVTDLAAALKK